jgi:hypothetical protein
MTPETEPSCSSTSVSSSSSSSTSVSGSSSTSGSGRGSCSSSGIQQNPWKRLPPDIMNIVLEYQGYHIFRNGKYMRQLDVTSTKYKALYEIPRIEPIQPGDYINSVNGLIQYTTLYGGCECTFMRSTPETDTTPKKVTRYTLSNYVYDDVTRWVMNVREIEYPMTKPNQTTTGSSRILKKGRIVWTQKYHIETVLPTNSWSSMIPSIEFIM